MPYSCSNCLATVYSTAHLSGDACPGCGAALGRPRSLFQSAALTAVRPPTKRLRGPALAASGPTRESRPVALPDGF